MSQSINQSCLLPPAVPCSCSCTLSLVGLLLADHLLVSIPSNDAVYINAGDAVSAASETACKGTTTHKGTAIHTICQTPRSGVSYSKSPLKLTHADPGRKIRG